MLPEHILAALKVRRPLIHPKMQLTSFTLRQALGFEDFVAESESVFEDHKTLAKVRLQHFRVTLHFANIDTTTRRRNESRNRRNAPKQSQA